eukprot:528532_1
MQNPSSRVHTKSLVMSTITQVNIEKSRQWLACCVCDVTRDKTMLWMCTHDDCSKMGDLYCKDCGECSHKKINNHKFDIYADHVKPVNRDTMQIILAPAQAEIDRGNSVVKSIISVHEEQKYGIVRQQYRAGFTGAATSGIIADIMIVPGYIASGTEIVCASGITAGVLAGTEIAFQTARFVNGDISTWKEYAYHISKSLSTSVGTFAGNYVGMTAGITVGTVIGGPIGSVFAAIIGGFAGGMTGAAGGKYMFDKVWSDDFILDTQTAKEQIIEDALKLFGIVDIKDIENEKIFNMKEIKKAYRALAKKYHPDKNNNSKDSYQKFQEVNAALGVLVSLFENKNKARVVQNFTEMRESNNAKIKKIKWKNDVQKLSEILKQEGLMYIIDICTKWDKQLTIEFLSTMRKKDILELIDNLNKDENYKYSINVKKKTRFANIIQTWLDDCKSLNDQKQNNDVRKSTDEFGNKNIIDTMKPECEETLSKNQNEEKEDDDFAAQLLTKWGLKKYINILIDEMGFDDIIDWKSITENELENDMKFKRGHARKFIRKTKEYFELKDKQNENDSHH